MLYFEEFGHQEAPVLVLLHSGGLAGVEWQPQVDALASRYRLIIPDLPAHGRSPLTVDKLTIGHMANQVLDLLDRLIFRLRLVHGRGHGAESDHQPAGAGEEGGHLPHQLPQDRRHL